MSGDDVGVVLSMNDVVERLGMSRSTINRMVDEGTFPKPTKLGARRIGWRAAAISEWLEGREALS